MKRAIVTLQLAVLFVSAAFGATGAFAANRERVLSIQKMVEDRLSPLVRSVDPLGVVYVKLEPKIEAQPLPMTPFVVNEVRVAEDGQNIEFSSCEIVVVTRKKKLPDNVLRIMQEMAANLGVEPAIRIEEVPDTAAETLAVEADKTAERKPATAQSEEEDKRPMLQRFIEDKLSRPAALVLALIALGLLFEATLLIMPWLLGRNRRSGADSIARVIENGFLKLSGALEGGGIGSGSASRERETQAATATLPVRAPASGDSNAFASLPAESIMAMLADCYWGESDAYASFIWRRVPIAVRRAIVSEAAWLADYASYLVGVAEEDLGADQEPYYLSPLTIWHIDNNALAAIVRKYPALYSRLPTLRVNALPLNVRERIEFGRRREQVALDFTTVKPSAARPLKSRARLNITSIEEEAQILAMPDFPKELRSSVPTLGWIAMLPDAAVVEILKHFSAKDLASAWIGPREVLNRLASCVPQRKLELMQSYGESIAPSRVSPAFVKLHQIGIKALVEHEKGKANASLAA